MKPVRIEDVAACVFASPLGAEGEALGRLRRCVLRSVQTNEDPDGLIRAVALAKSGTCAFCEEPLSGRRSVRCASEECRRAYQRAFKRDRACQHFVRERRQVERRAPIGIGAQP